MNKDVQQAGDLVLKIEQALRAPGPAQTTFRPQAVGDAQVAAELDRLEAVLKGGLQAVQAMQAMPDGFDRADRARALATHAAGLARTLWHSVDDDTGPAIRAAVLSRAGRINQLAGALAAAAGNDVAPSLQSDLADVKARIDNNRDNIAG